MTQHAPPREQLCRSLNIGKLTPRYPFPSGGPPLLHTLTTARSFVQKGKDTFPRIPVSGVHACLHSGTVPSLFRLHMPVWISMSLWLDFLGLNNQRRCKNS